MELNPVFISNITQIYGEQGTAWLQQLPNLLEQLSKAWHFQFLQPMPILTYNFVGLVKLGKDGKTAILKVGPPNGSVAAEIRWLNCVSDGVPRVYHCDMNLNALLMEHIQPGVTLKEVVQSGQDDVATEVVCQVIRKLQEKPHVESSFPHFADLAKSLPILRGHWDQKQLSMAQSFFVDLTLDRSKDVLLHGDLHHDNILSSAGSWKAIDPHGYLGDPAAEVGAMIRNPYDSFPNDRPVDKIVQRRLSIMSEQLPFDPQKINAWAFCITVLSAAWTVEGFGAPTDLEVEVATAIYDVIK